MNAYLNNSDAFKFNTNTFLKDKYFRRFLTEFSAAIISGLSITAVHLICEAGVLVEVSVSRLRWVGKKRSVHSNNRPVGFIVLVFL